MLNIMRDKKFDKSCKYLTRIPMRHPVGNDNSPLGQ